MHIIKLRHATVYRGRKKVFDRVSLAVNEGQNTAILGPNGSGKSTLLKLITREIYPTLGADATIEIFGRDRWNIWELRNRLGIISQDLQQRYHPDDSCLTVVLSGFFSSVGIYDHQAIDAEKISLAETALETLAIAHLRDQPLAATSTGEQRRCLLARALVNQPEALIVDEPTSGLDLPATFQYLETMRRLMHAGKTLVLVTHHIHEIPPEIEHVILLKDGRVMLAGMKAAVLTDENLSQLFEIPLTVTHHGGFYHAFPAEINHHE